MKREGPRDVGEGVCSVLTVLFNKDSEGFA